VRGYLNKAVELGLIEKPTRQTYAAPAAAGKAAKAEAVVADDAVVTAEVADVDPLAAV
jgi:hypothetical protein